MGKPEGKRLVGRPRHRWEYSVKIGLKRVGIGWYGLDLSGSG
jgi:hypothetical protein